MIKIRDNLSVIVLFNLLQSALHLAVLTRQHRLVRLLVCAGVELDSLDRYGNTALHLAVQGDDLACVRAIIDPVTIPEVMAYQLQYSPFPFHAHKDIANIHNYEGELITKFWDGLHDFGS